MVAADSHVTDDQIQKYITCFVLLLFNLAQNDSAATF
jgi:hypothetical protein